MKYYIEKCLQSLQSLSCPSGYEEERIASFAELIKPFVDSVDYDIMGNCYATKRGTADNTIMLIAHADEIGLLINYIDERGFLYFQPIGGIDINVLQGQNVRIRGVCGDILGVIGRKPIHLQGDDVGGKLNYDDLWIDIGVSSKDEATKKVSVGCVATICSDLRKTDTDVIFGRGLDDSIGVAILLSVAQKLASLELGYNICYVASVQEEIGSRGALVAASKLKPNIAIAIDVTHATDYPTVSPIKFGEVSLGKGAVIAKGPNINKKIVAQIESIAKENNVPYQIELQAFPSGTDVREIQVSHDGVATAIIGIPCRYMHTPSETISLYDAMAAVDILVSLCKSLS